MKGVYRLDFFNLLLCMAAGQIIIGNPFFGATVYLFADIIKAYYLCNLARLRNSEGEHFLSNVLIAIVFTAGISVAFIYPLIDNALDANYVSLFALCLVVRDYLGSVPLVEKPQKRGYKYYVSVGVIQLCFGLQCALLLWWRTNGEQFLILMAGVIATGLVRLAKPEKHIPAGVGLLKNTYGKISSYKLFSDMNLYATIAVNLGVMMLIFQILQPMYRGFSLWVYIHLVVWLLLIQLVLAITEAAFRRRWRGLALAEFMSGAIIWFIGAIMMFQGQTVLVRLIWTLAWAVGMAFMSSAVRQFYLDFEAVGRIMDGGFDRRQLDISNTIVATSASIISSVIMLLVMNIWTFVVPLIPDRTFPRVFNVIVMQLPAAFMVVAVIMALRQPLDYRNREKLMRFIQEKTKNEHMRRSLERMFVGKYRMRFGIKILCTLVRPFLRLKVSGKENLCSEHYPSVFVSNHNFIYGPIAAVTYLPTYFRPWIHNVMLEHDPARREIFRPWVFKLFGKRLGGALLDIATNIVCWALNSFNPIPVVRGASRDVMSTFNASLKALEEGDNILIFPEKPKKLAGLSETAPDDTLRSFYTGFAHVGKMYHDRTGLPLYFYPLYSDMKERAFRIGPPVVYNTELDSRESKKLLAEELQERIEELRTPRPTRSRR